MALKLPYFFKKKSSIFIGFFIILLALPFIIYIAASQRKINSNVSAATGNTTIANMAILQNWFWMADQKSAIDTLQAIDPSLVQAIFTKQHTFVLQSANKKPVYPGIPVAKYRSFQVFQHDIATKSINPAVKWVMYDNEKWSYTPLNEQQNPLYYEKAFATLAHQNGYKVILAPAQNLIPGFVNHSLVWQKYLAMGLATVSAEYGDIYEIQAQPYEDPPYNSTDNFQQFVTKASIQARSVNPHIIVLAGVSTHRALNAQQLAGDMEKVKNEVSGFWFNVPKQKGPSRQNPAQMGIDGLKILAKAIIALSPSPLQTQTHFMWMISDSAISAIEQNDPKGNIAQTVFNTPNTYLIGKDKSFFHTYGNSLPTITFTSYDAMKKAFANNTVKNYYKAVIYDNENWQFTPLIEQQNVAYYYAQAAALVHRHHLIFIATPATNLVNAIDKVTSGSNYDKFISLGIAGSAAKYADIYEIQAQGSEANTALYTSFVTKAVAQAKEANSQVIILAGLSTNPSGQKITSQQLFDAIMATQSFVSGYWLNIPSGGSYCPKCGISQPQVAVSLLHMLGNN